jgi:hypothetical protein
VADTLARLVEELGLGYRDIKPRNLYELDGRWLVGDFGLVDVPNAEELTPRAFETQIDQRARACGLDRGRGQYPSANLASSLIFSGDHGGTKTISESIDLTPSSSPTNSSICSVTCGPIGQPGVVSVNVT